MHCQDAPCMAAGPDGAVYRRADGIVLVDPAKASGRQEIVSSCPYRVIYWNGELSIPQKCTFCAHLLDRGWKLPRCVDACPTGALIFGDLDDAESEVSRLMASRPVEVLHPEYATKPGVFYIGLPKRFIAGEVVLADREDECAEGVKITLSSEAGECAGATDSYGDFELEGLAPDTEYRVRIEQEGYVPREVVVRTKMDINLGTIFLNRNA